MKAPVPVCFAVGKWDNAHQQIADWLKAGEGPDLVVAPDIWLVEFADSIQPMDPFVDPKLKAE